MRDKIKVDMGAIVSVRVLIVSLALVIMSGEAADKQADSCFKLSYGGFSHSIQCMFYDVCNQSRGIWWQIIEDIDDKNLPTNAIWRVQARIALDTCHFTLGETFYSVGVNANLKRLQHIDNGYMILVTGPSRHAYTSDNMLVSNDACSRFLTQSVLLATQGTGCKLQMCASGMDYFFIKDEMLQYALFIAGMNKELVFTYAIGLDGNVKQIRFPLDEGVVEQRVVGTIGFYDSDYSVRCDFRSDILRLRIRDNDLESVELPISLHNVKTLCSFLKAKESGEDVKWKADRAAFDVSELVF